MLNVGSPKHSRAPAHTVQQPYRSGGAAKSVLGLREIVLRLRCRAPGELDVNDGVETSAKQRLGGLLHYCAPAQRLQGADAIQEGRAIFHDRRHRPHMPLSGHLPVPSGSAQ
jgi:hypothetical protein